ncbi:MAG: EutN/CcmL family microcompartment protein [bacterium]|nr:EutN/CcmL family microcompartment protein [bacterium]
MRIAQIIGTVVLSRHHETFRGATLKFARPLSLDEITGKAEPSADPIVVWDELGAGIGDRIAISEGGEAAQPFFPDHKPVDAYNAAILDRIDITITS